ncbi:MAG: type VI secretion system contractile sheath large subunit [Deltaproteobacteria bacterium]|nr:type VI secretion system contractile sheath large subunit [Deltaproteobacteria bacterium]
MQIPPMPFKILALGPFSPETDTPWHDSPIKVDKTNLDEAIQRLGLSLYVPLDNSLCSAGGIDIGFEKLKDFLPDGLLQSNPVLKNILGAREFCEESRGKSLSEEEIGARLRQWPDLPPIQISSPAEKPKKTSKSAVDDILKMVALPEDKQAPGAQAGLLTDQINAILKKILSHIFSHEDFRNFEAAWQGLQLLINQGGINGEIQAQIVPVSFETLEETLDNLTTHLVRDLPSLVIVDLPFNNSPRSLECLEKIARFAETLLAPALCWVTREFLHLDSWDDLNKLSFLPHHLDEPPFAKWRSLADSSSARWLAVTCNRFLARFPYGPDNRPRLVPFQEAAPLWISPVWGVGCLVSQSVVKTGWPTRFTDWQDIRLEDLALDMSRAGKPIATETAIGEDRIDQFARAGITPLVGYRNKDIAFVLAEATVGKGSLSYQMFLSRITHFVLWCKDHFDKDLNADELEKTLYSAISAFWQKSGDPGPKDLSISAGQPLEDNRIPLRIVAEPTRRVLPSGEKVELEFLW